jgi:hypothetical protein
MRQLSSRVGVGKTLETIKQLIAQRRVRVSDHGLDELRADGLKLRDILESTSAAELVEDYPDAFKGPTILALHWSRGTAIHVVWGLAKAESGLATLVTAYVPDPQKWYDGFLRRRPK